MSNLSNILIIENSSIKKAMELISINKKGIVIVVNFENKVIGTVTDGDIRRHLFEKNSIDEPITSIMNKNPILSHKNTSLSNIINLMRVKSLKQIPIINEKNQIIDLVTIEDILIQSEKKISNKIVIMAGGYGKRLNDLTNETPKPMLKVGNKPILEIILEKFYSQGFFNIYISTMYKANIIENYFQDGSIFGVNISYLREDEKNRLGTAGILSRINKSSNNKPIIVINGDIITDIDFNKLLNFHNESKNNFTICARKFEYTIPYGVIENTDSRLINFKEKPSYSFSINAGIYVISPKVLNIIPENTYFDMDNLIKNLLSNGEKINTYDINGYWIDIGKIEDYNKVNQDFIQGII